MNGGEIAAPSVHESLTNHRSEASGNYSSRSNDRTLRLYTFPWLFGRAIALIVNVPE